MERNIPEKEMVKYGKPIRAHPEFIRMINELQLKLAAKEHRRYSTTDITKLIYDNMREKNIEIPNLWRFKWR